MGVKLPGVAWKVSPETKSAIAYPFESVRYIWKESVVLITKRGFFTV